MPVGKHRRQSRKRTRSTGPPAADGPHYLTIFRALPGIEDPDILIKGRGQLLDFPVRVGGSLVGVLYVKRPVNRWPRWLAYFEKAVDFSSARLATSTSAAVLIVKRGNSVFAVVFGYGRVLLNEDAFEPRFGLRATLNAIESTQIRSMDRRRLDAVPRTLREQLTRASSQYAFGVDVERDLLRAVTGVPSEQLLGIRISGSDALTVVGQLPLEDLPKRLEQYSALADMNAYQARFAWVDNIRAVEKVQLRLALDEQLAAEIRDGSLDRVWLAPPGIIDYETFGSFQYRPGEGRNTFAELSLDDYFRERRPRGEIMVSRLRSDRVWGSSALGSIPPSWSVYKCLIAETEYNGERYMLSEGQWYCVSRSFLEEIDAAIEELCPTNLRLPRYAHRNERNYNRKVAQASEGYLHLLDRDPIHLPGRDPIEACDLYSKDRHLVHVKQYGSSSHLSHLFSQGLVSAELLAHSVEFREALNNKLPASHRLSAPQHPPDRDAYEVAYAIVRPSGRALSLPFFSKVNLRNCARRLRQIGFHVTLTSIDR